MLPMLSIMFKNFEHKMTPDLEDYWDLLERVQFNLDGDPFGAETFLSNAEQRVNQAIRPGGDVDNNTVLAWLKLKGERARFHYNLGEFDLAETFYRQMLTNSLEVREPAGVRLVEATDSCERFWGAFRLGQLSLESGQYSVSDAYLNLAWSLLSEPFDGQAARTTDALLREQYDAIYVRASLMATMSINHWCIVRKSFSETFAWDENLDRSFKHHLTLDFHANQTLRWLRDLKQELYRLQDDYPDMDQAERHAFWLEAMRALRFVSIVLMQEECLLQAEADDVLSPDTDVYCGNWFPVLTEGLRLFRLAALKARSRLRNQRAEHFQAFEDWLRLAEGKGQSDEADEDQENGPAKKSVVISAIDELTANPGRLTKGTIIDVTSLWRLFKTYGKNQDTMLRYRDKQELFF